MRTLLLGILATLSACDPSDSSNDTSTTQPGETGSPSLETTDLCPDYDALPLEELLANPGPGGFLLDGASGSFISSDFGQLAGEQGFRAAHTGGWIFIPFDDSFSRPTGRVVWSQDGVQWEGEGTVEVDYEALHIQVESLLLSADGSTELELSACLAPVTGDTIIQLEGDTASIDGTLGGLTTAQVERIHEERPEVTRLSMGYVPGSTDDHANMQTGRLVRAYGWSTAVVDSGTIASGGVDLFCAGFGRSVGEGAQLGVHSWSDGVHDATDYPEDHHAHQAQLEYHSEMLGDELGPAFYWFTIYAAPADGIHWMTEAEIDSYGLESEG